ncbi:hypothetical protein [Luteimonas abyssi]|uniref:hypothetical protein n=1 Tax=Luteimonas abyssi TaxID=1247514 RepID=UPI00138ED98E|nr:hypothetical protein [Luteimonas abyssi]
MSAVSDMPSKMPFHARTTKAWRRTAALQRCMASGPAADGLDAGWVMGISWR